MAHGGACVHFWKNLHLCGAVGIPVYFPLSVPALERSGAVPVSRWGSFGAAVPVGWWGGAMVGWLVDVGGVVLGGGVMFWWGGGW